MWGCLLISDKDSIFNAVSAVCFLYFMGLLKFLSFERFYLWAVCIVIKIQFLMQNLLFLFLIVYGVVKVSVFFAIF